MFFQNNDGPRRPEPDEGAPEKTGPHRFWELLLPELASLLKVNFLFVLTCIPVVTIPPALFALHRVVCGITHEEPAQRYFAAFKSGWKRAYGAFFAVALPMALAAYGGLFYLRGASDYFFLILPFALCAVIFWVAALSSSYLYGLLCGGGTLKESIRTALMLAVARPLRGALAALCFYGLPLVAILFLPLSAVYLLLIGFSLPYLLGHFYLRTVLRSLSL